MWPDAKIVLYVFGQLTRKWGCFLCTCVKPAMALATHFPQGTSGLHACFGKIVRVQPGQHPGSTELGSTHRILRTRTHGCPCFPEENTMKSVTQQPKITRRQRPGQIEVCSEKEENQWRCRDGKSDGNCEIWKEVCKAEEENHVYVGKGRGKLTALLHRPEVVRNPVLHPLFQSGRSCAGVSREP